LSEKTRPAAIIALTDDLASPLAGVADSEILLRSQSSGSSRGFLNILAAHDYITSMILGQDNDDVMATARVVADTKIPDQLTQAAASLAQDPISRLIYIGFSEHAAAALYAALLTQETTTVTAEGYPSDNFDLSAAPAGFSGSTAVLFIGRDCADNARAAELAADLVAVGADVVSIGSAAVDKAMCIRSPAGHVSAQMAHSVVIAEYFVSLLAA
jgi:fructoselysine-6-P-deglycase FrlB-like protein